MPPKRLIELQKWFGGVISTPIDENSAMAAKFNEEVKKFITPSPSLKPHERIEIYNQQYWWRLLSILHDTFPFATNILGHKDFNFSIGFLFLTANPSDSWDLNNLGKHLPKWMKESYRGRDKELLENAVTLDLAFNESFLAHAAPNLSQSDLEELSEKKLFLQPHVYLFEFEENLFLYREELEPQEQKLGNYCLYRAQNNQVSWEQVNDCEYFLLNLFARGATLDAALQALESKRPGLHEEVALFFQKWALRGIFTLHDTKKSCLLRRLKHSQ